MATLEKFRLSAVTWNSDTDPDGFLKWIGTMSNLVRSTQHGEDLEIFIDEKLGRNTFKPSTIPTFILGDSDFDAVDDSAHLESLASGEWHSGTAGSNACRGALR